MKKLSIITFSVLGVFGLAVCLAQTEKQLISFEQLFPESEQHQMGLHKLSETEKDVLRAHVEGLLVKVTASSQSSGMGEVGRRSYAGGAGGHWIKKNVDSGTYMILEDGSLWQIDPLDKIDAMLWLPISNIRITKSTSGSPGFDYLLINTDDGEKAHAKYMGQE
jgi:hypothetical protein